MIVSSLRLWPPLLVPPVAFLTLLSAAYALIPVACEAHSSLPLHLVAALSLAIALGGAALAWRDWRSAGVKAPHDQADKATQVRFLAVIGLMMSGLIALATVTLWIANFIIPPCAA